MENIPYRQCAGSCDVINFMKKFISDETFKKYRSTLLKLKPLVLDHILIFITNITEDWPRVPCICGKKKSQIHTYNNKFFLSTRCKHYSLEQQQQIRDDIKIKILPHFEKILLEAYNTFIKDIYIIT